MAFGFAVTQDVPKGPRPGYVGDSRARARDVAALDAICARRPLKPPAHPCTGGEVVVEQLRAGVGESATPPS